MIFDNFEQNLGKFGAVQIILRKFWGHLGKFGELKEFKKKIKGI